MKLDPKKITSVMSSSLLGAAIVTPFVVMLSNHLKPVKQFIADHIIEPHLSFFEKLSSRLRKSHEAYDAKRNERRISKGKDPVETVPELTPQQWAADTSDKILTSGLALTLDTAAAFGLQYGFDRVLHTNSKPARAVMWDAVATLGCITLMPTVFAGASEYIRHQFIRKTVLQNMCGMDKDRADKVALAITYGGIPSVVGSSVALIAAHR